MSGVYIVLLVLALALLEKKGQGAACPTPTVFRLTDEHGVITTPNFPDKFPTPICYHWIIDSGEPQYTNQEKNGKKIRIHMTQSYLKENFTVVEYVDYTYPSVYYVEDNVVRKSSTSGMAAILPRGYSNRPSTIIAAGGMATVNDTRVKTYATDYRYFGVQVELYSPYANHFRAMNFLNVYGFNITYEIVSGSEFEKDYSMCTVSNCSVAGNCYVSKDFRYSIGFLFDLHCVF